MCLNPIFPFNKNYLLTPSQEETTTIQSNYSVRFKSRILEWYLH